MARDFFANYFEYIGETESPMIFHRWSILSTIAAALGRRCHIPLGHYTIYPSMYTMLVGASGTRKSSAMSLATKALTTAGYMHIAADKTTKDKFLLDLMDKNHIIEGLASLDDLMVMDTATHDAETFIVSEDLQDFLGTNNLDFVSLLGRLWEVKDSYEYRLKAGTSTKIEHPVVNLLSVTTPTGVGMTFPPEILGQGFMSKIMLIYGETTGKRISFPEPPNLAALDKVVHTLSILLARHSIPLDISLPAREVLDAIYQLNIHLPDPRFVAYETRRHDHLLKLVILVTLLRDPKAIHPTVSASDVRAANTMLICAEHQMPQALGEFGKGKFSEVGNALMEALHRTKKPLTLLDLWKIVAQDLSSQNELVAILRGLQALDKVQTVSIDGQSKFLPVIKKAREVDDSLILRDFLTEEENMLGGL